jgi:hypothetical protein
MEVRANGNILAVSSADSRNELSVDLSKSDPGPATLEIRQFGVAQQELPVVIKKRNAHIQRLVHFDLESDITAYGENLERIESIQAGRVTCRSIDDFNAQMTPASRAFSCSGEISANANFPAQVTVNHKDQEPASFECKRPTQPSSKDEMNAPHSFVSKARSRYEPRSKPNIAMESTPAGLCGERDLRARLLSA